MLKAEVTKYGPPRAEGAIKNFTGRMNWYTCGICTKIIEKDQAVYQVTFNVGWGENIIIPNCFYACSEECVNIGILRE